MSGMLHLPKRDGPVSAVLFLHGFTGDRNEKNWLFVKLARRLATEGIAALRFDFRGSGESEGAFSEMTFDGEVSDAHAAFAWLREHPDIDAARISVLGFSLGGAVAAYLAAQAPVSALAMISAPARVYKIFLKGRHDPAKAKVFFDDGCVDVGGHKLGAAFIMDLPQIDPVEHLGQYTGPLLLIHGTDDEVVPVEDADIFQAVRKDTQDEVKLVRIPGADHVFGSLCWVEQVLDETAAFFAAL